MRRGDRMERFVVLPIFGFGVGCMSESSVGVASSPPSLDHHPPPRQILSDEDDDDDDKCSSKSSSSWSWSLPKPNLSSMGGINKLFKTFSSHLFVYKEEEEEMEIEIGVPTDVKHVTHIGWDGVVLNNITGSAGGGQYDTNNINNNERLQLLLSNNTFNHHHHPCSAAAFIPQTDGQDHTHQSTPINPPPNHLIIPDDQLYKQIIGGGGAKSVG